MLLPFYASREVAIGRGENAHSKVTYTNVVPDIHQAVALGYPSRS